MVCTRDFTGSPKQAFPEQFSWGRYISDLIKTHLPQAAVCIFRLARYGGIVLQGWRHFLVLFVANVVLH